MVKELVLNKCNPLQTEIITRNGREAFILKILPNGIIKARISNTIYHYTPDGRYSSFFVSEFDLINAPKKEEINTVWVNIHEENVYVNYEIAGKKVYVGYAYTSEQLADQACINTRIMGDRVACVEITYKKGDGI